MYKNLEKLINELCPNGVEYRQLNELFYKLTSVPNAY